MSSRGTAADPAVGSSAVAEWRRDRLLAAGFASALAAELARDRDIDLHAVLGLIDRGCPPELAARIVAPLDGRPRWWQ
jgi:hypothetical protein